MSKTVESPLGNHWWMYRSDGTMVWGEYPFVDAGDDVHPDWVWAEEEDRDEPVEYVCERFLITNGKITLDRRYRIFEVGE